MKCSRHLPPYEAERRVLAECRRRGYLGDAYARRHADTLGELFEASAIVTEIGVPVTSPLGQRLKMLVIATMSEQAADVTPVAITEPTPIITTRDSVPDAIRRATERRDAKAANRRRVAS